MRPVICLLAFISFSFVAGAQTLLNKTISVDINKKSVEETLNIIGKKAGFYFSYNSELVPADSIITIHTNSKTVRQTLDMIFAANRFEYKETRNHIIIRNPAANQFWYVSGYVIDEKTGKKVRDVSVFESNQLVASLTNEQGYFRLKLKDKFPAASISISNTLYNDTSIQVKPGVDQEVTVKLRPRYFEMENITINSNGNVEGNWFSRLFLSSKQRIQSMNLKGFFVDKPIQGSLVPGLSTHGRMGSQVVNNFSLNMIGGYTAGVAGVEIGSVFNIVKKDVKYFQGAGFVNIIGGDAEGVQFAGIHNNVMDSMTGVQAAGISNAVKNSVIGVQAAGIYNFAGGRINGCQLSGIANSSIDTLTGVQGAGIVNLSVKQLRGVQMSGVINTSIKDIKGLQAAGVMNVAVNQITGVQLSGVMNVSVIETKGAQLGAVLNYANRLKGVQFGLFNYANKSEGASIGLFSFVLHGYHKLSYSANEALPYNVSFKTGTHWLYNIYTVGGSPATNRQAYSAGFGWGSDIPVYKWFSISPEVTAHVVYLGDWNDVNLLNRGQLNVNVRFHKMFAIFGGPVYSLYYNNQKTTHEGYRETFPGGNIHTVSRGYNMTTWVGWNAGITIF